MCRSRSLKDLELTEGWTDEADVGDSVINVAINAPCGTRFERWVALVVSGQKGKRPLVSRGKDDNIRSDAFLLVHLFGLGPVSLLEVDNAVLVKMRGPRCNVDLPPSSRLQLHVDQPSAPPVEGRLASPLLRDVWDGPTRLAEQQPVDVEAVAADATHPLVEAGARARDEPRHVLDKQLVGDPLQRAALDESRDVRGVEERRDGAVQRLVGPVWVGTSLSAPGAVRLGHYLGGVSEAVTVAHDDAVFWSGGHGQVGEIHRRLAYAQHKHGVGGFAELGTALEGGGVHDDWARRRVKLAIPVVAVRDDEVVRRGGETWDVGEERLSIQASTYGHNMVVGGALDEAVLEMTFGLEFDDVARLAGVRSDGDDRGGALDILPQTEPVCISLEVLHVSLWRDEVDLFLWQSKV